MCTRTRGGKDRECARAQANALSALRLHEGASAHARTRAPAISAREPVDVGAERIDNNLSIQLWKLVGALVEISNIGNH